MKYKDLKIFRIFSCHPLKTIDRIQKKITLSIFNHQGNNWIIFSVIKFFNLLLYKQSFCDDLLYDYSCFLLKTLSLYFRASTFIKIIKKFLKWVKITNLVLLVLKKYIANVLYKQRILLRVAKKKKKCHNFSIYLF